jgi:hypothetical protein
VQRSIGEIPRLETGHEDGKVSGTRGASIRCPVDVTGRGRTTIGRETKGLGAGIELYEEAGVAEIEADRRRTLGRRDDPVD